MQNAPSYAITPCGGAPAVLTFVRHIARLAARAQQCIFCLRSAEVPHWTISINQNFWSVSVTFIALVRTQCRGQGVCGRHGWKTTNSNTNGSPLCNSSYVSSKLHLLNNVFMIN